MKILKIILCLFAIGIGPFLVVFGERDDSPGAQMLGLVIGVVGIVGLVKLLRRKREHAE